MDFEFTIKYTGSDPDKAFKLAKTALGFKGFKFESSEVNYSENADGSFSASFQGTNSLMSPPENQSSMNNAGL